MQSRPIFVPFTLNGNRTILIDICKVIYFSEETGGDARTCICLDEYVFRVKEDIKTVANLISQARTS